MAKEITSTLKGLYPDHTFPSAEVVPDSLILQIATVTSAPEGDVPVVRVPYVENDPTVGFVKEGEEIPTANPKLNEVLIQTKKLAILSEQSREASSYEESALAISTSLQRAITMKADHAFLNSEADPTGLWNMAGVIDAGTVTDSFDPFTDAIMGIEANMGKATAIVIDPAPAWKPRRTGVPHPLRPAGVCDPEHGGGPRARRLPRRPDRGCRTNRFEHQHGSGVPRRQHRVPGDLAHRLERCSPRPHGESGHHPARRQGDGESLSEKTRGTRGNNPRKQLFPHVPRVSSFMAARAEHEDDKEANTACNP